ncbi:MAG: hypothetical protein AAGI71_14740 [Bacteroidota bacterium]
MYTPLIGRRLLDRANARDGLNRSPAEFFDEVFFPLFFGNDRYLMTAGNSKFGQLVNNRKKHEAAAQKEGRPWDDAERSRLREIALTDFHGVATDATEPQSHLVLGGYARGSDGTTSGQVTGIDHQATADEVYLSWIGAASGAGVAGGVVLLIEHEEVLDAILEGWSLYRDVLTAPNNLKANQIETWNGQWLRHRFSARYRPDDPTSFIHGLINTKKTPYNIETVSWARLVFSLGRQIGDQPVPAYVYSLGQTNTTLGFIPLHLGATGILRESYTTLRGFYRSLFGDAAVAVEPDRLDEVYDAGLGFKRACEEGAIGLHTLRPAKLETFLLDGKNKQPRPALPADAQTPLLYQTWILAMLGNQKKDLYERAAETAEMLLSFETGAIGGKMNLKKEVKAALAATTLSSLIDSATVISESVQDGSKANFSNEEIEETLDTLDALVRAALDLSPERLRLFLALLRFQVALLRGKSLHATAS